MGAEHYLFHQYRHYPEQAERKSNTPHQHEFWQVDFITEGTGRFYCNPTDEPFSAGDIIIIPPRNLHYFNYDNGVNSWLSVKFSSDCDPAPPICLADDRILRPTMAIIMEALSPAFFSLGSAENVVNAALGVIVHYFLTRLREEQHSQSEFVRRILQFLYESEGRYLSVSEIGDAIGCSGKYAAIRFRQETGIPLKTFIDQQRGEYAARLLKTSSASLNEIAAKLDFRDVYAFSRFFRRTVGDTLSGYRGKKLDAR